MTVKRRNRCPKVGDAPSSGRLKVRLVAGIMLAA